jgi:anti-sigma B factor antagonist
VRIVKKAGRHSTELIIRGRLDAYWSDHLSRELHKVIREGAHHLVLDLSNVSFMSSAGIGILLKYYKLLKDMNGSLTVSTASISAKKILELSGLADYLVSKPKRARTTPEREAEAAKIQHEGAEFEIFRENPGSMLACRLVGNPELLKGFRFRRKDVHVIPFPKSVFGIGLGSLGDNFKDCRGRFGEFLAASGTAAYLPTDGTNIPDYMIATKAFVPELRVLYGIVCESAFSHQIHFEVRKEPLSMGLTKLVHSCMNFIESPTVGIVMLAETEGLVGAALRQSPALKPASDAPFKHPHVRKWLTFTSERAHQRNLALIVGIADSTGSKALKPFVRPLGGESPFSGHFHALVFPYCPLRKGRLNLSTTIGRLYDTENLHGLLHLIQDDRDITGVGQSEFIRGNCWVAGIKECNHLE